MALRPWLELIRLPAVFTAPSDVLAGVALAAVAGSAVSWTAVSLLVAASAAIYCAGMAANDLCDLAVDRVERPKRPLPSGRISTRGAWTLVLGLQALGVALAVPVGRDAVIAVAATVAATWLYNALLKGTLVGPLAMGLCRYGNATIGLAVGGTFPAAQLVFVVPLVTLFYVAAVTSVSRHEVAGTTSAEMTPRAVFLCSFAVLSGTWAMVGLLPVRPAAVLALVPLLWLVRPAIRAAREPSPGTVRGLVMAGIFGIALVNAVLAASAGGFLEAAVAAGLLIPGRAFGRWFYAT